MKKYDVMGPKFRNKPERYDAVTSIVGGFVDYKLMGPNGITLK